MGKFLIAILALTMMFIAGSAMAEEKMGFLSQDEFKDLVCILDGIKAQKPSDSIVEQNSMYLDFQRIIAEIEERKAISPSLEEKKRLSIIQEKMRGIVSGPHCEGGRKLERIRKIVFGDLDGNSPAVK